VLLHNPLLQGDSPIFAASCRKIGTVPNPLHKACYGPLTTAALDETQPANRRKGDPTHATLVWRLARQPKPKAPHSALGEQASSRRDARAGNAGDGAGVGGPSRPGQTATHTGRLAGRVARVLGQQGHGTLRADDGPPGTLACGRVRLPPTRRLGPAARRGGTGTPSQRARP
jgi:hypothetical protein